MLIFVLIFSAQVGAKAEMRIEAPLAGLLEYSRTFGKQFEIDLSFHTSQNWSDGGRWKQGDTHGWMGLEGLYPNLHVPSHLDIVQTEVDLELEELVSHWYVKDGQHGHGYGSDKGEIEDRLNLSYERSHPKQIEAPYPDSVAGEPYRAGFSSHHFDVEPSYQNDDFHEALDALGKGSYDTNHSVTSPGSWRVQVEPIRKKLWYGSKQ